MQYGPVQDLWEIEDALRYEVIIRQERLDRAVLRPTDNAGADKRVAIDDLAAALQRWDNFVFDSVIPEDLMVERVTSPTER